MGEGRGSQKRVQVVEGAKWSEKGQDSGSEKRASVVE